MCGLGAILAASPVSGQSVEQTVYAGVLDRSGAVVTDLTAGDFIVRENGVAREVLRAAKATDSLQVAVLVDTSAQASGAIGDIRRGVQEFIRAMGDGHEIALVGFGERPTVLVDYTRDRDRLLAGADRLFPQPSSGSYLLDALVEVSQGLQKREEARRVVVVLTLQGPEYSERYHRYVVDALAGAGVALHAFVVGSPVELADDDLRERRMALDLGASTTGGRQEDLLSTSSVPPKMRQLAEELIGQYAVVYARPQALIPPDSIAVSVRRADLVVHAPTALPQ
jgi:Ca-activated chloride channel family protein